MKRVAEGKKFRVFQDKLLGVWTYFILEDSTNATRSQGVDYNVKLTNYYFQTLAQTDVSQNLIKRPDQTTGLSQTLYTFCFCRLYMINIVCLLNMTFFSRHTVVSISIFSETVY